MIATIHQPYFLPWLGYFSKLSRSDTFIVLDNVLFRKRHYMDRTRIINMHGQPSWLGLPIGDQYRTPISAINLPTDKQACLNHILKTIEHSYARAHSYRQVWPLLRRAIVRSFDATNTLVSLDVSLICGIAEMLD